MFREHSGVHDILSGNPDNFQPEAAYTDEERRLISETKERCASVDERNPDLIRELASKLLREIGGSDHPDQTFSPDVMPIRYSLESGRYGKILESIEAEKRKIGDADHLTLSGLRVIEESARRLLELADLSEKVSEVQDALRECVAVDAKDYGNVRSAATRVLFSIGAKDSFERPFRAKNLPTDYFLEPGRYEKVLALIEVEKKKIADAVTSADSRSGAIIEESARELLELADEMTETLFRPRKIEWAKDDIWLSENGIGVARKELDEALGILRANGIDPVENERKRKNGEPYERVSIPDGPVGDAFDAYLRAAETIRTKTEKIDEARGLLDQYDVRAKETAVETPKTGKKVPKGVLEESKP
ncbi:MAG: hypothetical protein WCJ25_00620 [Candidatus Moraniibacteriota bacterium]